MESLTTQVDMQTGGQGDELKWKIKVSESSVHRYVKATGLDKKMTIW